MRRVAKLVVIALALFLASCGSSKPGPQHSLKTLSGKTTTLALAPTFVQGLSTVGAAPTPVGKAKVAIPNIIFPITGGHLDIYKSGDATPPVQGQVEHQGSGL